MLRGRTNQFTLTGLGIKAYMVGGWHKNVGAVNWVERYGGPGETTISNQWDYMAGFPHTIYRHCTCADEEAGRLYVSGNIL